jgi:diguanylate cyclase (GGDEF)-like protein/PAS domain S-box-containing protein
VSSRGRSRAILAARRLKKKSLAASYFRSDFSDSVEPSIQQFENNQPTGAVLAEGLLAPGLGEEGRFHSNHYLLNAMSDGVLALDPDSRIHYANSTACRLLGYSRANLNGRPVGDIIADTMSPDVTPRQLYDPGLTNGELVSTDTARFRRADGGLFQVMLTAIPVTDAGVVGPSDDHSVIQAISRLTMPPVSAADGAGDSNATNHKNEGRDAPIAGLLLVFRDVSPGLYLSLGRINQLLTRLMTRQGARSTIEAALGGVADIVQADFAILGAYETEGDTVLFDSYYESESFARAKPAGPHAARDSRGPLTPLRLPAADTPYSYIYHNRQAVRINDYERHSLARAEFLRHGAACLLATPVLAESRLMGVVYFFRASRQHPFTEADLENVRALGPVLSAAFFKADNETRLTELATTDPLTGLLNRRVIFEKIQAEIERAARYESEFSALMLDLDFFKAINDAYGHLAGDRVLSEIGRSLCANTRSADAVARTGGEEFLILLPQTGLDGALRTAEKIRDRVAALRIQAPPESGSSANTKTSDRISVTTSIGCASYRSGESGDEFYARLDQLLYQSKQAGRDRITS